MLIYNDYAGSRGFKNDLDPCLKIFQDAGYEDISVFRSEHIPHICQHLNKFGKDDFDTIVAAGGDGTLNAVVSSVLNKGINTKIGIIPAGTSNDFASHLKIEKHYTKAAEIITKGNTIKVDVGKANDRYFINVFGAGLITNISHYVDPAMKSILGNFAYYLKGIEKLQSYTPMPVKITTSDRVIEEDIYFFLALNSARAGGFDKLVEGASVRDGLLDMLAVRAGHIGDIVALLLKFFMGEHINDERVIHFRDKYALIEGRGQKNSFETNIDGENGPPMPVEINMYKSAIEVYM